MQTLTNHNYDEGARCNGCGNTAIVQIEGNAPCPYCGNRIRLCAECAAQLMLELAEEVTPC